MKIIKKFCTKFYEKISFIKASGGKIKVETINADPDEILVTYNDQIAELINQYLK